MQMNLHRPFVSVIIPVLNNVQGLEECLAALEDQSYPRNQYECLVVDNGSKESFEDLISKFPNVLWLKEKYRSSYAARNKGIQAARGEILAFTDSDCIPDKSWIEQGVLSFANLSVGCVGGQIKGYRKDASKIQQCLNDIKLLNQKVHFQHYFLPYAATANAFYRKNIFDQVGLFDPKLSSGGDAGLSWKMQLETSYQIAYGEQVIVYHQHRKTIADFFKQVESWGGGALMLERKYKQHMIHANVYEKRYSKNLLKHYFVSLMRFMRAWLFKTLAKGVLGSSREQEAFQKYVKTTLHLGFAAGMLKQQIKMQAINIFH